ncbi:MAG TPA: AI-2E family transporter [Methanothermobacter sp.]|uniref:AI-2E family transporter n=1 Tax=Methanothermobacter tenebrarum TaxID=680118 RepID=A0ABN6PAC2_9EURY|nr:AI-2E family transporter [Methanothermobacter tenebrarum]MDD3454044.1 AI-2E family transporter [Methanobacteriales archaeon]MDI6882325.1 AI-2E family transporter [Methanothermobacter sp.]MDX9693588.1 AI-2E family transporter [Methanothermobacter sp.]BDH78838.1 AI-2E family transporter [Methanothermobacter tenebrarum]HHW17046.1 AI-2E family transporter [Methanothermobacter sp.]
MIYRIKGTITSSFFIILVLLILSAIVLYPIWTMLFLGAIFAYGIRPIADKLTKYIPYRSVSIAIVMVVTILPLIGVLAMIANTLFNSAPALLSTAQKINLGSMDKILKSYVPSEFLPSADILFNVLKDLINNLLKMIIDYLLDLIKSVPMIALQLFILFASAFYFARDGEQLVSYASSIVPEERKDFMRRLIIETERVIKSIFYGHFLTAFIIGLMAIIGFQLLGYPYAIFLGLLAGFFQLIPVIGPWPTYTILAIYDFIYGNILRGVIVLIFGAFLSSIDVYLRPKLSGKYADIHPLLFLVGFLGGPLIWGLAGFIIGPLILGVAYAALNVYREEKTQ